MGEVLKWEWWVNGQLGKFDAQVGHNNESIRGMIRKNGLTDLDMISIYSTRAP